MVEPGDRGARSPGGPPEAASPVRALTEVALVAGVAVAHATQFLGTYQYDDWRVIVGDPRVQSLSAWWRSMPGIRPLLKLTYAVNHASGLGLPGFHAVNLAIHAAAAVLALRVLERLGRRLDPAPPPLAAPLGALLFALHPVQTEAVTYLSGRSSALAGALALASVLAFLAGRDEGRAALVRVASPLLLACSLLVKEGALVLPLVLVLCEALDRRRPFAWRPVLRATAGHWAVAAAGVAALLVAPPYQSMLARSLALRPPAENLLTHARATLWLAGQLIRLDRLVADPDLAPVRAPTAGALLAAAAVAGLAALALALLRRRPAPAFAALWFLLWLAPQGWWLPRPELASERQLYLALLGPAWLAGLALARLPGPRWTRVGAASAAVLLLGAATAHRNLVYRDEVGFWEDVVAKVPGNARAHTNLGYALALACLPGAAASAWARATDLDPEDPTPVIDARLLREGALLPADAAERCRARGRARALDE